jgi:hypothetical protein
LEESQGGQQDVVSMEAASEQGIGSDQENRSEGSSDDENASNNGGRMKIGAEATLAGISYDFGNSGITQACMASLEGVAHHFLNGYG